MQFVGQLSRRALARFYALHHVGIFPSIHPEAFGIVAAEMLASGIVLVSSGVGGSGELIDDGRTGILFQAGDSKDLARCLKRLVQKPTKIIEIGKAGQQEAEEKFSVMEASKALESNFKRNTLQKNEITVF